MSARYLLIDAATPLIQAMCISDGSVVENRSSIGNSTDLVSSLVGDILSSGRLKIEDFSGLIFCSGPGSAMGLRVALTTINVWKIFSNKGMEILEYCSLEMCMRLNHGFGTIVACGTGDSVVVVNKERMAPKIIDKFDRSDYPNSALLKTKYTTPQQFDGLPLANYEIANANFPILSICRPSDGVLCDFGHKEYDKWTASAHCSPNKNTSI